MSKQTIPKADWRRRTSRSFFLWILGLGGLCSLLVFVSKAPLDQGIPTPLRTVHEWNGTLWAKVFSPIHSGENPIVPVGKVPRVNGTIGLEEDLDPESWSLEVITDRDTPGAKVIQLHLADLLRMPQTDTSALFKCIEGWSEEVSYRGVRFSDFLQELNVGHLPGGNEMFPFVGMETPDGKYYVSLDMDSMLYKKTILAVAMNGQDLAEENGAPLRLVIPLKYGIKNIKRIGRIFFSRTRPRDYWTERGYDWYSGL